MKSDAGRSTAETTMRMLMRLAATQNKSVSGRYILPLAAFFQSATMHLLDRPLADEIGNAARDVIGLEITGGESSK
ncbi:MAG: hypothetical protein ACF787_02605 [Rhodopirellula sp. JB053]